MNMIARHDHASAGLQFTMGTDDHHIGRPIEISRQIHRGRQAQLPTVRLGQFNLNSTPRRPENSHIFHTAVFGYQFHSLFALNTPRLG